MTRYVPDASIAVKWYVPEIHSEAAARLLDESSELHVPDLIVPEFGSVIWKKVRRSEITGDKGRQIIRAFLELPLQLHSSALLLELAFELANRTGQTVYDCTYLALAVTLECPMITADVRFHRALLGEPVARNLVWVETLQ